MYSGPLVVCIIQKINYRSLLHLEELEGFGMVGKVQIDHACVSLDYNRHNLLVRDDWNRASGKLKNRIKVIRSVELFFNLV